ncbi:Thiamine-phosphate synthase [Alloiococcus otitis]|uniref:Thiamine-phosphate synthase n=1 Tax=Alloiococcus otitis ATCC 51267 TaxID=883081 RepID=K9ERB8_9LACT|nr:thiamine phosphate synthase [Alloiococcus otitis]EKU93427.1 thiamine-phosphate pyrophosphorylase [Alloiococcus otitis ATCC 51267]SUU81428.1 Thiamine-phosphate synthase [Alloiococcus otitis]
MTDFNPDHLTHYFIVGPQNTLGRDPLQVVEAAIEAGMTMIQIRDKEGEAKEIIDLTNKTADLIQKMGKEEEVSLLVNDRLDIVLACRDLGYKVDGIHVGQDDIPVSVCRKYLGPDSIVGLSAATHQLIDYVKQTDTKDIDYFGAGPLHETATKPDAGYDKTQKGPIQLRDLDELKTLADISPIPVVVGGGVKAKDLADLKQTGVAGYFVVSAIAGAHDPGQAARELITTWQNAEK